MTKKKFDDLTLIVPAKEDTDCLFYVLKELEDLQPFRIMWSGGLDSSLVLWLCLDRKLDKFSFLSIEA